MNFDPYLPADCQGKDSSFPWDEKDIDAERDFESEAEAKWEAKREEENLKKLNP